MIRVDDEVAFGLENLGVPVGEMRARVAEALESVGLANRATWPIVRLSGGQQQLVALAAVLAMRPRLLILDEVTAHLAPRSAARVYRHIAGLATAGPRSIVIVEHDLDKVVPDLVNRCLLLGANGTVLADGSTAALLGAPEAAARWAAAGLWLPAPVALALSLGEQAGPLPLEPGAAARWLVSRPDVQHRLRRAARPAPPAAGDIVLEGQGLWQRYAGTPGAHHGLRGVDILAREGEMVAVVGANGGGKTTLLRALGALLPLERGTVRVAGVNLHTAGPHVAARLVAHVFQNPESGFVAGTVTDELAYGPRVLGWDRAAVARHVDATLERFGLAPLAQASPFTLSQGQKRRLSVAVALLQGPRVLLLDEPTFGQDRRSALAMMAEIAALRRAGLAVIVATHDLALVLETADRVVALAEGAVLYDGPPAGFVAGEAMLAAAGQERPALARILAEARALGADVPALVRWAELDGSGQTGAAGYLAAVQTP